MFGSRSPEHDISIITGQLIISGLRGLGYGIVPIYIGKNGQWYIDESLGSLKSFTGENLDFSTFKNYYIDLEKSVGKMVFVRKGFLKSKEIQIDLAFPAFHGLNGEDGTIQGLFEIFNIPYVGCDVTSSAVTMDKVLTKLLYQQEGIATTKFIYFEQSEWEEDREKYLSKIEYSLTYPLFVKPARLGSSIAIEKVKNPEELVNAIEVALKYDNKVLVENGVEHLADLTCSIIGNENPRTSLVMESKFGEGKFYDYDEKYISEGGGQLGKGESKFVIPAQIHTEITSKIQELSAKIFKYFGCSGIARVDWLYNRETKELFANEINTLPGTLYHHLWKASGLDLQDLLKDLVELAEERRIAKNKLISTFKSEILKNSGAGKLKK